MSDRKKSVYPEAMKLLPNSWVDYSNMGKFKATMTTASGYDLAPNLEPCVGSTLCLQAGAL